MKFSLIEVTQLVYRAGKSTRRTGLADLIAYAGFQCLAPERIGSPAGIEPNSKRLIAKFFT